MCKLRINMSELDAMIRFYIAIFFMVVSVASGIYALLIVVIVLVLTAIKRRCFLYALLGLNQKLKYEQYYKNIYMQNNSDIIIFLDEDDEILYSNKVESRLYLDDIFSHLNNYSYKIQIDNQNYTIKYCSFINEQIRLIELKK